MPKGAKRKFGQRKGLRNDMASSFAKVSFMGCLGRDPEIRYTQGNNTAVANFSIAVNRKSGGEVQTDWFDITAFGNTAELAEKYLKKGNRVVIDGELQTQSWTDKNTGAMRTKVFTVVNRLYFLDSAESKPQTEVKQTDGFMNIPDAIDEELPFV